MAGALEALPSRHGAPRPHPLLRVTPPWLAWALASAALAAHGLLWGTSAPVGRAPVAGAVLAAAGTGVLLWAWWCFVQARNPIRPTDRPRVLIDHGPFALSRHPMYAGMTAMLAGAGLGLGVPLLGAAALTFAAIVARVHVPHEEAVLRRTFGGWYSDYTAEVPRWLRLR